MPSASNGHPKVFISYAWEDEKYKQTVLSFAVQLRNYGIDVKLDQWDLKPGNDMYAFMEGLVLDKTVSKVLILLSPLYEQKANDRTGGVGAETQLITGELYGRTDQDKYLPVVFRRNPDNSVPRPAYLKNIISFDLTDQATYDAEYQALVKTLYRVEPTRKPELGSRPAWVDEDVVPPAKTLLALDRLKGGDPDQIKRVALVDELRKVTDSILGWPKKPADYDCDCKLLNMYLDILPLLNDFNRVARHYPYIEEGYMLVADALERLRLDLDKVQGDHNAIELKKTMLHELFLYFVAIMIRYGDEAAMGQVLTRRYLANSSGLAFVGFGVFQHYFEALASDVKRRDEHEYLSPFAVLWLDNIDPDSCTSEEFILADELCFNVAVFNGDDGIGDRWFPRTYIYDHQLSVIRRFTLGMESRRRLEAVVLMFGIGSVDDFVAKYQELEKEDKAGKYDDFGYQEAYNAAPLLPHIMPANLLGTKA